MLIQFCAKFIYMHDSANFDVKDCVKIKETEVLAFQGGPNHGMFTVPGKIARRQLSKIQLLLHHLLPALLQHGDGPSLSIQQHKAFFGHLLLIF